MNIVVTGSIAYDYIMSFPGRFQDHILPDQIDRISLSFLVDALRLQRGGTGPNIAYNMALLGGRPRLMATAGQDFADYRAWLEAHGVDTSSVVEIPNEATASYFVSTDEAGNHIASFYTGAMAHAHTLSFREHANGPVDLAVISPNDPGAMIAYVRECKALGIPYLYDPSWQIVRLSAEELLEGITGARLVVVNDYEFGLIVSKTGLSIDDALRRADGLIITKGREGSTILADGDEYEIESVPAQREADPTGAGDAYRGGLLCGLARGMSWQLTGRIASLAATYSLEEYGPQNHQYTRSEFVTRFREHFDDEGALDVLLG
jgi:adenosine kinase